MKANTLRRPLIQRIRSASGNQKKFCVCGSSWSNEGISAESYANISCSLAI